MKQIYIFSGLGVDESVFKYLDFTGFDVTFIKWTKPDANESIEDYAKSLTSQITTMNPILIGLSFGGMIATEIAKFVSTEKIILIASAKTYNEIPFYYRWAGNLKLHRILPIAFLKQHNFISDWLFGIKSKEHREMFAEILNDLDSDFLKWAIDKILSWKNMVIHPNTIHVHADEDLILPLRFVNADVVITNGGHFMTVNKAKEVTEILHTLLS